MSDEAGESRFKQIARQELRWLVFPGSLIALCLYVAFYTDLLPW